MRNSSHRGRRRPYPTTGAIVASSYLATAGGHTAIDVLPCNRGGRRDVRRPSNDDAPPHWLRSAPTATCPGRAAVLGMRLGTGLQTMETTTIMRLRPGAGS